MAALQGLTGLVEVRADAAVGRQALPDETLALITVRYDPDQRAWPEIVVAVQAALEADPANPHPVSVKIVEPGRPRPPRLS